MNPTRKRRLRLPSIAEIRRIGGARLHLPTARLRVRAIPLRLKPIRRLPLWRNRRSH